MPFVFDVSTSDEAMVENPRKDYFQFLPAPDLGGVDPAFLRAAPPREPGVLARLFGKAPAQQKDEEAWARDIVGMLAAYGVQSLYCRFDGGMDEGFAWLDHAIVDGAQLSPQDLGAMLAAKGAAAPLRAKPSFAHGANKPDAEWLESLASDWLSPHLAGLLLTPSFGTGEYLMYGAFFFDLASGEIREDPQAAAVSQCFNLVG
jgi:hypothetical protein